MEWKNRFYCGDVSPELMGKEVFLMGWVDAIRDHGNVMFIHLRDIRGMIQVVFNPQINPKVYESATALREEYVVEIRGEVCLRDKGNENPNLVTGELEVLAKDLSILSTSKSLPFRISEKAMVFGEELQSIPENVDEELRLQFRYLDFRRPSIQAHFIKRHQIIKRIREYLDELNFLEIETPFLTKSTPEGARDFLVPSRVHQGKFYALPQSPQLFKQILMMGGMDRYFQIARCFRDEDLRPNRQPEFTQLDLEASFIDEEFIYEIIEELTVRIFDLGGISLSRPFPRMTYDDSMESYGTDRPDLRFEMAFKDVTEIMRNTNYAVFKKIISEGGLIKGFCVKGKAGELSKNILQNEYAMKIVPGFGAKGMTWMKVTDGKLQSNIAQFFSGVELEGLVNCFKATEGDVLMMIADVSGDQVNKVLNNLRLHVANRFGIIPQDSYRPLWVTDFPLFELKDDGISSQHHPFTMPDKTDFDPQDSESLLSLKSRAYDLVMNGEELGGGSIRIHKMDVQKKIFEALGLKKNETNAKFGFFLKALEYGTPPHAGLALGLDRVISMILKTSSIRDVIAFPKNRSAVCPLTKAPSPVDNSQLDELALAFDGDAASWPVPGQMESPGKYDVEGASKTVHTISAKEVKHVAKLARLSLDEEEIKSFQKDLNSILAYVDTLRELDTENVNPMSHVLKLKNVWREDRRDSSKQTDPLLSNAPSKEKNYFKVPKILEG